MEKRLRAELKHTKAKRNFEQSKREVLIHRTLFSRAEKDRNERDRLECDRLKQRVSDCRQEKKNAKKAWKEALSAERRERTLLPEKDKAKTEELAGEEKISLISGSKKYS